MVSSLLIDILKNKEVLILPEDSCNFSLPEMKISGMKTLTFFKENKKFRLLFADKLSENFLSLIVKDKTKTFFYSPIMKFAENLQTKRLVSLPSLLNDAIFYSFTEAKQEVNPNETTFFIKGKKILQLNGENHITYILEHPETFGFDLAELKKIYKNHNEAYASSGEAEKEILTEVMKKGWIQVQVFRKQDYWIIHTDSVVKRINKIIDFVFWAIHNNVMKRTDGIDIQGLDEKMRFKQSVHLGGITAFLNKAMNLQ